MPTSPARSSGSTTSCADRALVTKVRAAPRGRPTFFVSELEPLDLYDVRGLLGESERLVQDTVARFVQREALPIIDECFAAERFPIELVPRLAELGLFGATLREHGGAGLSYTSYGLICQELEAGDSALRSCVSVQSSLVMGCIAACGTPEQRERWLPHDGGRQEARLLRTHRSARRLRPGAHAHTRRTQRPRLGVERRQDVDHERHAGRRRGRVGGDRRASRRVPRRARHARVREPAQ